MKYTSNKDPNFWMNNKTNLSGKNCGSYALDVLEWYRPYDLYEEGGDDIIRAHDGCATFLEALEASTKYHVDNILDDFHDIRIIDNYDEAESNERIILYREGIYVEENGIVPDLNDVCTDIYTDENSDTSDIYQYWDWDFHFIWRDISGYWHEKNGSKDIKEIEEPSLDDVWISPNGEIVYQGPVVIFAKKENNLKKLNSN